MANRREAGSALNWFGESLAAARTRYPPPFDSPSYRTAYMTCARDPYWVATSLVANSLAEAKGARGLWQISRFASKDIAQAIRRHAIDEARHARLYLTMLKDIFPTYIENAALHLLQQELPEFRMENATPDSGKASDLAMIDDLIQINIGEIRTRIHAQFQQPILMKYSHPSIRSRTNRILRSILRDEDRHIQYTSEIIERFAFGGHSEFISATTERRLVEFSEITRLQVRADLFE